MDKKCGEDSRCAEKVKELKSKRNKREIITKKAFDNLDIRINSNAFFCP